MSKGIMEHEDEYFHVKKDIFRGVIRFLGIATLIYTMTSYLYFWLRFGVSEELMSWYSPGLLIMAFLWLTTFIIFLKVTEKEEEEW